MSRGNTTIVTAIIAALIGGLVGFFIAGNSAVPGGRVAELEAQIERAKRFFPAIPEIRSVSGTVRDVSGSTITIDADASPNPFEEWPTTRTITVGEKTRIIVQAQKDPATYQREFEAYRKQIERRTPAQSGTPADAATNLPTPPMPFEEREIQIDEIELGSRISAEAAENIKTAARFEATLIRVQSVPGGAGMPTPAGVPAAGGAPVPPPAVPTPAAANPTNATQTAPPPAVPVPGATP
jgi:hypothetical protein